MIVWWSVKSGAHAAAHSHPHEQIVWMLKGRMEFRIGSERKMCRPGDIAVIPGGVEHEAWFHEDTEVIDVFAPPREDFLAGGTPAYMQEGERVPERVCCDCCRNFKSAALAPSGSPENPARQGASAAGCGAGMPGGMSAWRGSRVCRYEKETNGPASW